MSFSFLRSSPALLSLCLAIVLIQCTIFLNNGMYSLPALFGISLAIAAIIATVAYARRPSVQDPWTRPVVVALCLGVVLNIVGPVKRYLLGSATPIGGREDGYLFAVGVFIAGILLLAILLRPAWSKRWMIVPLVLIHLFIGYRTIHLTPDPGIDVFGFQKESCRALVDGSNPYALRMPNRYSAEESGRYYSPETVNGRFLRHGFPYPPLSLFMALPGHLLGDIRYALLAAMAVTALLLAYMGPGRQGLVAAGLYLFGSQNLFVLMKGWTEPFAVLLLALAAFAWSRKWRSLPYLFGLLLSVKQYTVLMAIPTLLLAPRNDWRHTAVWYGKMALVVVLTHLPFVFWGWRDLFASTVLFHFHQPFRADALSFPSFVHTVTGITLPSLIGFIAAAGMTVLTWLRVPRNPFGFSIAVAAIMIVFFAFNKQAFANYYFFIIGALCCAMAAWGADDNRSAQDHEVAG